MTVNLSTNIVVNADKLKEELIAAHGGLFAVSCRGDGTQAIIHAPDGTTLQQIQATLNAHNPALLTTNQKSASAISVALEQGKIYLRQQLVNASPNVTTIYNTIKAQVDGNPHLLQMVTNQIALAETAFIWTLNLASPTAADRVRYIFCVQMVIGLLT